MRTRWYDWTILIFGSWLICSPWWLQFFTSYPYTDLTTASWESIILGIVIVYVAIWALAAPQKWEEWINLTLGLGLVISPWVLGFQAYKIAVVNILIVGGITAVFAAVGLRRLYFSDRISSRATILPHKAMLS